MTIVIGLVLIVFAVVVRSTSLDLAVPFAPGWHVTIWPVSGAVGLALIASTLIRWR